MSRSSTNPEERSLRLPEQPSDKSPDKIKLPLARRLLGVLVLTDLELAGLVGRASADLSHWGKKLEPRLSACTAGRAATWLRRDSRSRAEEWSPAWQRCSATPILLQKPSSPRSEACRASQRAKEEHKAHPRCLLLAGSVFQEQRRDPRDVAAPTGCRELQDTRCCR